MRGRRSGLVPIREIATDNRASAEARMEARATRIWPLIVGPVLVRHTRLIRIRQRTLIVGCWTTEVIASLRQSAEATWPQVQARLERLLGLKLKRMDVVPCDPPQPPPPKPEAVDPLSAVLRKYRALGMGDLGKRR